MTNQERQQLAVFACHVRMGVIEGTHAAKAGHGIPPSSILSDESKSPNAVYSAYDACFPSYMNDNSVYF